MAKKRGDGTTDTISMEVHKGIVADLRKQLDDAISDFSSCKDTVEKLRADLVALHVKYDELEERGNTQDENVRVPEPVDSVPVPKLVDINKQSRKIWSNIKSGKADK